MQKTNNDQSGFAHILLIIVAVVLLIIGFAAYKVYSVSGYGASYTNPPKFIQHDFIGLDHITSISKFRSEAGHDFSGGGETCSSMKHYFAPNDSDDGDLHSKDASKKLAAVQPDGKTDIAIYSPVTGTIVKIESEHTALGKQVMIVPDSAKGYSIRLFHITPDTSLHGDHLVFLSGSHVTAGQKIGVISVKQDVDIAVQTGRGYINPHFISYFDVMPDTLFASYQARGLANRSDIIISKAEREAHPFSCKHDSEDSFIYPANYNESSDYVRLIGYVAPKNTPNSAIPASSSAKSDGSTTSPAKSTNTNTTITNTSTSDICKTAVGKPPGCP